MKKIKLIVLLFAVFQLNVFSQCEFCSTERIHTYHPELQVAQSHASLFWKTFEETKEISENISGILYSPNEIPSKDESFYKQLDLRFIFVRDLTEIAYNYSLNVGDAKEDKERFIQSMRTVSFHLASILPGLTIWPEKEIEEEKEVVRLFEELYTKFSDVDKICHEYLATETKK